jgi:hypothetical protein
VQTRNREQVCDAEAGEAFAGRAREVDPIAQGQGPQQRPAGSRLGEPAPQLRAGAVQGSQRPPRLALRDAGVERGVHQAADGTHPFAPGAAFAIRGARVAEAAQGLEPQPRAHPGAGRGALERRQPGRRGPTEESQARRRQGRRVARRHHVGELDAPATRPAHHVAQRGLDVELPRRARTPALGAVQAPAQRRRTGRQRQQQRQQRPRARPGPQRETQRHAARREHQRRIDAQPGAIGEQDAQRLGAGEGGKQSPQAASSAGPGRTRP